MRGFGKFVLSSLVRGLLIIIPLYLAVLLLLKAMKSLAGLVRPLAMLLPEWLPAERLLSLLLVLLVCFLVGAAVRTRAGRGQRSMRGGIILNGALPDGSPKYAYPPNLTTVCGGPNTGHTLIKSLDDIYTTIEQGRIDAGMPSWSIKYAGALDDQQIGDIVQYLVYINDKNVPFEQNVCVNEDAADAAATPTPSAGASASGSAGATTSETPSASESPTAEATP